MLLILTNLKFCRLVELTDFNWSVAEMALDKILLTESNHKFVKSAKQDQMTPICRLTLLYTLQNKSMVAKCRLRVYVKAYYVCFKMKYSPIT